jgi:small-conductance mechanosensitive channel
MTGTHILINTDPQKLEYEVNKFVKDKKEVEKHYSTTPLIVGVDKLGNAQIHIYVSVFIKWECTNDEWQSYLFAAKTLIK